ncbi:VOC family protein [Desulfonauticus submarinus]
MTQHSSGLVDKISPYQLFFNKHPAAAAPFPGDLPSSWEIVWRDTLGCQQFMVGYWPELHAQFWYEAQSENTSTPIIRAALMPVFDMGASKEFWTKALGFSLVGTGNLEDGMNWAHITFRSFVRSWSLDIILLQNESSFTSYLDDPGFPCLALITNHIMRDREEALRFGAYNVSDSFELRIGENLLNIVLLRGPSNELVELIQLKQIQR